MSRHPGATQTVGARSDRAPVTVPGLASAAAAGERLVMVTAYDHAGALAAEAAGVDMVLVGDSAANTVLGYESTTQVSLTEMLVLTAAVRRGLRTPLLVGDLPFGTYEASDELAVRTAVRFVHEAGVDAVKLEGGGPVPRARAAAVVAAGIPVVGHVGLTPQHAAALGGFRAQGRDVASARRVRDEALALQEAGCFAVVLEAVPADVTERVVAALGVVTIGIGAGPATDGQVLVFHDLLGLGASGGARFVRRYEELQARAVDGLSRFAVDVRSGVYPAPEHTYALPAAHREEVLSAL